MGSHKYGNESSGSINYGNFYTASVFVAVGLPCIWLVIMTVTIVPLGQGWPKSTHKAATQFVKELPEGPTFVYFCVKGLGLNSLELLHLRT
jgi:hypothetical protein